MLFMIGSKLLGSGGIGQKITQVGGQPHLGGRY